jgi:hypothetical protein
VNVVTIIRVQPKIIEVPSKHSTSTARCELQFNTVFSTVKASGPLLTSFGSCCAAPSLGVLASALTPKYHW